MRENEARFSPSSIVSMKQLSVPSGIFMNSYNRVGSHKELAR